MDLAKQIPDLAEYGRLCEEGRAAAAAAIRDHLQTENTPRFVRAIRHAAEDSGSGYGAGFLFALAERVE